MLNTANDQGVELPGFTPRLRGKNLDTAIAEPSAVRTVLLPILVIAGVAAMLTALIGLNDSTSPIPPAKVMAQKTKDQPPHLATLSDVLRELGHSWDETSNTGKIKYLTLPKEKEPANLKQYLGQPLLLRLIHTAKLADPTQEILFFSSTPIPKDSKSLFDCHACYPLLSAMVVTQTPDKGLIATVPLQPLMFAGSWGTIAMDGKHAPTLVKFGPKVNGFTLQHSYGNQGENRSWVTLHSIKGNRFNSIGEFDSEVDSLGSYSCDTRRTREACKASVTVSTFHESASSEGYYDLSTSTNTTYIDNGVEEHTTSKERMRFNGKRYASVEAANESRVPKSNPSPAHVSSGGNEPAGAPAPEAAPKATATRKVLPLVDEFAVRKAEFGTPIKPYDYSRLETEHRELRIQHESKPSFFAELGARLSGNTSERPSPQSSDGANVVVAASSLPSENSKTPEEQIVVIVKRKLKDTAPLTRTEHAEFWRLMNSYSPAEQANLLQIVRVNLLGAAKFHVALIESAAISATNGKVVKTAELIELTAETRRVFLTTLPASLVPAQRADLVKMYDEKRVVTDRNNDNFLKSAAAGRPHKVSEQQTIPTDAESLRAYPAILRQGINRVLRLIDPVWRDETKTLQ